MMTKMKLVAAMMILLIASELVHGEEPKIDAMTGLECVDNHEQCPFWAATGGKLMLSIVSQQTVLCDLLFFDIIVIVITNTKHTFYPCFFFVVFFPCIYQECQKNPKYMGKDCRLSCDKCHVVRLNSANDIGKFLASKKGEIEAKAKEQQALKAIKKLGVDDATTKYENNGSDDNNNNDGKDEL